MNALSSQPLLDPKQKNDVLGALNLGCSRRSAARYAGCSRRAIENTARCDPVFNGKLSRARENAQIGYIKNIRNAAQKEQYWRAAAWALERMNPEDFALRDPDAITIDQVKELMGRAAQIVVEELPNPRLRRNILKRIATLIDDLPLLARRKRES